MREKRTPKTPRQRAEEALGVAQRRVAKCTKKLDNAKVAVTTAESELRAAERRLKYVAADPALPQPSQPDAPTNGEDE